jgi:hypothetical protein
MSNVKAADARFLPHFLIHHSLSIMQLRKHRQTNKASHKQRILQYDWLVSRWFGSDLDSLLGHHVLISLELRQFYVNAILYVF